MRRRIADVASGMHTPNGENMWSYPAKDSFSDDMEKAATGLLDVPKEIPGDSTFEQAPHMLEETDQGVGGLDRIDPTASSAEDSEIEMKTLVSALAVELNKRGYVKYAQSLENCKFEVDQMGEANDPLATSLKIDRKDLHQVTFTSQTGLEEVPTNVSPVKKELTYLGYLGYSNLSDVSWDLKCVKAWEKLSDTAEEFLRKTLNAENNTTIKNGGNPQAVVSLLLSMLHSGNLEKVLYVMQYIRQLDDWAKGVGAPSFKAANIRERRLEKMANIPMGPIDPNNPDAPVDLDFNWKNPFGFDPPDIKYVSAPATGPVDSNKEVIPNTSTSVQPNKSNRDSSPNERSSSGTSGGAYKSAPSKSSGTLTGWNKYIAGGEANAQVQSAWLSNTPDGHNSTFESFVSWYNSKKAKNNGKELFPEEVIKLLSPATTALSSETPVSPAAPAEQTQEVTPGQQVDLPTETPAKADPVDIAAELEKALRELATKEVKFKGGPPFRPERKQVVRWVARNHGDYPEAVQHIMQGTDVAYWQKLIQDNNTIKADSKGQLLHAPLYNALYNKLRTDKKEHRQERKQTRRDERKERRQERAVK